MSRILLAAQRLPVTAHVVGGEIDLVASTGGVSTGLTGVHRDPPTLWIGWPGLLDGATDTARANMRRRLAELRLVPVELSREQESGAYEGYANGVLWPLFHYETNRIPLDVSTLEVYREMNERFAAIIAAEYSPGDIVWVHDYQLLLVPQLVRERIPNARIGFFLHIPFPSSEVFRALPHREVLLEGMLAADLVGFHTAGYMRHFVSSAQHVLGASVELDRIRYGDRIVHLGVFPMGIDAQAFASTASDPAVLMKAFSLHRAPDEKLLLGIDRLDYTKGIPRRLIAFERMLEQRPELRGRVRLIQVGVPSRENVEAYQSFRSKTDELIGRIHGTFATADWVPVHWIHRSLSHEEVVALYRAADVMLVTPLRDGMNLVAKEYVASRTDEKGVLVLSEFAGAASELAEAIQVNPFDVESTAEALYGALVMSEAEMHRRMRAMRERVFAFDAKLWATRFIDTLITLSTTDEVAAERPTPPDKLAALAEEVAGAPYLILLLDYDGTVVPLARTPDLAAPDARIIDLLAQLCARPATEVHIVSGRSAATLEGWLGHLPLGLYAEYGLRWRRLGQTKWDPAPAIPNGWRLPVLHILHEFAERVPGSLVEEKETCVAWHYRAAEPHFAEQQVRELRSHLLPLLSNEPVEILSGLKVIEVRPQGYHKGGIVELLRLAAPRGTRMVAIGNDRTDEEMFAAVGEDGLAIRVGAGPSRARVRIATVSGVRDFLRHLLLDTSHAQCLGRKARRP